MPSTTISSREFNQQVSRAKRESHAGPVIITDRGRPAYVLMTIEEYRRVADTDQNLVDLLSMPEGGDIAFEPPRLADAMLHPAVLD